MDKLSRFRDLTFNNRAPYRAVKMYTLLLFPKLRNQAENNLSERSVLSLSTIKI